MFYNFSFFLQSLQWTLFNCGMTIEPCLKFYAVPSQSQCMILRSRSQTLNFFVLNLFSVSCCKAFDWFESCLVWMDIRFLNASERKRASQASCPVRRQVLLYLQVMRTCLKSPMSSNFGQFGPLTMEFSVVFDPILFILAGNEVMHKISDEFEFWPDRTIGYGVSCLWASKKLPLDL